VLGQTLGSYTIERELGRGGMGAVYAAVHTLLGRRAAVKVLLAELSRDQAQVQRFFNEARAATAIKHPSIVEIYDFGWAADGSAYIVMEYMEGEALGQRLQRLGDLVMASMTRPASTSHLVWAAVNSKTLVSPSIVYSSGAPQKSGLLPAPSTKILMPSSCMRSISSAISAAEAVGGALVGGSCSIWWPSPDVLVGCWAAISASGSMAQAARPTLTPVSPANLRKLRRDNPSCFISSMIIGSLQSDLFQSMVSDFSKRSQVWRR